MDARKRVGGRHIARAGLGLDHAHDRIGSERDAYVRIRNNRVKCVRWDRDARGGIRDDVLRQCKHRCQRHALCGRGHSGHELLRHDRVSCARIQLHDLHGRQRNNGLSQPILRCVLSRLPSADGGECVRIQLL
jgi:hypothetical protein